MTPPPVTEVARPQLAPVQAVQGVHASRAVKDRKAVTGKGQSGRQLLGGLLDFELPAALEAHEPPEARGVSRDSVRLLVASGDRLTHSVASALPGFLSAGDVVVVNTSTTLAAAVTGRRFDGRPVAVHFSGPHRRGGWVVELRRLGSDGTTKPFVAAVPGEVVGLPGGGLLRVGKPEGAVTGPGPVARLWRADLNLPGLRTAGDELWTPKGLESALVHLGGWLSRHGEPIRYAHVPRPWPLDAYQTIFARVPGSAEMPSAARPLSWRMVIELIERGVVIAPVVLHAGVSSQEAGEGPLTEPFAVPEATAERVNDAHRRGHRVVAVGTTVVRALESAASADGDVQPARGWTDLVVTPERGVRVVDGLVTGWHEPRASHLAMLEAVAGRPLLEASYRAALEHDYRWHEFGDWHLILPEARLRSA